MCGNTQVGTALSTLRRWPAVDPSLYEAATVDGASKIQRLWHIDVPFLIPTAVILLIMRAGNVMNLGFEKVYLMQNPLNTSISEVSPRMYTKSV